MLFDPIIANPVPVLLKKWEIVNNPSEDEKWDSQIVTVKSVTMSQIDTKKPRCRGLFFNVIELSITMVMSFDSYGSITLLKSDAFSMSTMYMTGGKASVPEPPPGTTA